MTTQRATQLPSDLSATAEDAKDVTPNDSGDLLGGVAVGLYVGTAGDVKLVTKLGSTVTYKNCPDGSRIEQQTLRVLATGTTASNILALY